MTRHSSIIGGSNAGRLINCPASHQTLLALPPAANISSDYAEEGTAMHAVMDAVMLRRQATSCAPFRMHELAKLQIGSKHHDRVFTQEHYETMVGPAIALLIELEEAYGGDFVVYGVEQSVRFPGVAGAFGTIDLILKNSIYVLHVDWKFGSGVGVRAVYLDDEGAIVNPQLMFYLAAARATLRGLYARRQTAVAIIQPRGEEPRTHTVVDPKEIRWFVEDVQNAVTAAIGRDPPRTRGEWCRFAPCKSICPHWTGPLLELAVLKGQDVDRQDPNTYGEYLSRAKALVDSLVMLKATIDEQMHTYLEQGGTIPGWRLKLKAKQRQWADIDTVFKALRKLGFEEHEIMARKLVTFQQADATAKAKGVKIPDDLRVAPPSNETTLATTNDPAPVVEPAKLMEQFSASLKLLKGA